MGGFRASTKRSEFLKTLSDCKGDSNIDHIAVGLVDDLLGLLGAAWEEEDPPTERALRCAGDLLVDLRNAGPLDRKRMLADYLDMWYQIGWHERGEVESDVHKINAQEVTDIVSRLDQLASDVSSHLPNVDSIRNSLIRLTLPSGNPSNLGA